MRRWVLVAGFVVLSVAIIGTAQGQSKQAAEPVPVKVTGQCHCGQVRYEAAGPVVKCSSCDCRGCQRASGTFKVPFVTFSRDRVTVTAGQLSEFRAQAGAGCDRHGVWQFCPKCGTQVFWKGDTGVVLDVFAGTLDDLSLLKAKE